MGRLTEIFEAINHNADELTRELFTSIDLKKHNDAIKEARKEIKKTNPRQGLLFGSE